MTRHASALAVALMVTGPVLVLGVGATSTLPTCATTADLTPPGRWEGEVDSQRVSCLGLVDPGNCCPVG